ncbi:MBL fold metallo-hydrolase [Pollutibacter soli]|uniref:MBL fold metallo-hydrolase n=1 Tax=Pollutibacter soli TaxID=3034157 RepID=UPI003014050A
MSIHITHIDTACVLLEINNFRILTDPTLDDAGGWYYHGSGSFSKKTTSPAVPVSELKDIDLILLSHHQHKDNFDHKGKAFTKNVSKVISTKAAAKLIPGITGLDNWESLSIHSSKLPGLKITATPAQHHPWWIPEFVTGKVIGFLIEFEDDYKQCIYISGDTVYFKGIEEVAKRFTVDIGIFHVGSVQFRYLTGFGQYTMNSSDLLKSVQVIQPGTIIPIHHKGWSHFKEKESHLQKVVNEHPEIRRKTVFLVSGERVALKKQK